MLFGRQCRNELDRMHNEGEADLPSKDLNVFSVSSLANLGRQYLIS